MGEHTETGARIAIVLYEGMTLLDAIGPYEVLRLMPGASVRFVAREVGPIVADSGVLALSATHTFDELPDPDILLVPGSTADTMTAMADEALISWIKTAHETSRFTTSVCTGALVLAAAGLLKGHEATTHWAAQRFLPRFGATARSGARTVRSGKIWTAAGVSAGIDLGLAIVGAMCGQDEAELAQLFIEYDPQPPFDSGHMSKARPEIAREAKARMVR
ncbi:MAG: DJ-1/PfpI family protein, partial [Myxococcota bacterium]